MSNSVPAIRILPTEQYFALVRQQLAENGQAYVRVTGVSMMPLLRHLRDGVIVVPPEKVRLGDIVLFDRRNGRYALHRVVWKGKKGFFMAGDNQWYMEKNLPYDQIVGVAAAIDRNDRRIPCGNFLLKMYAVTVSTLTFPRIYLGKLAGKLKKLLGLSKSPDRKGGCE
ncbi:MAG: S24/S26 family peptidase [Clostridia bacterium]|nr:S24/S26 family peptidase [Clostridia bacterium]